MLCSRMGVDPPSMALDPDTDLNDTDESILDLLSEGRVTPQFVSKQLDITRPYASQKLKRLVEHDHVVKVASGLYELRSDPRDNDSD